MHEIDVAYSIFSPRLVFSIPANEEPKYSEVDYAPHSQRVVETVFLQSYVYTWILLVAVRIQLLLLFLEVPKIRDIRVSKETDLEVLDMYDTPESLKISVSNRRV